MIRGGSIIPENLGLLGEEPAWLLCGVIASVILFLIPEPGKRRDPKDLIFYLIIVAGTYAIFVKMHRWLADLVGGPLAIVVSVLVFLVLAALFVLFTNRTSLQTSSTTPKIDYRVR